MSGTRAQCVKKNRIQHYLHSADERLRTRALRACTVVPPFHEITS
jgi:hypothetical protein